MSVEILPYKRIVSKEELVVILHRAVVKANRNDLNALGVILFGSRTHTDMARPDSDVDYITVQKQVSINVVYELKQAVETELKALGLISHYSGTIFIDWIDGEVLPEAREVTLSESNRICGFLDKDSVFTIVDPEAERKIKDYAHPEQKRWVKAGLHPTKRFN